ncbi:MAG TPA: chemotaxis protein CheW [Vagococcus sp.]|uniref:Positive regulator of CheA protein activity (CheW) n=2 Tax=Enterococcaceae TaxID=81852 RepID=A0A1X6WRI6_9ENTE|nr:Positive regulator of CheA protein activity (CheW) [Vagococcus fluvialis bH819]HCM88643.1 chemotaxis protein CheW [Vagococcus sp.]
MMEKQIVFFSQRQELSLPIKKIEKIIQWTKPIPIPETSLFVLGVVEHNAHVLPIIDLNQRLYGESTELNDDLKIIVVQWKDEFLGLVVESIRGIVDFSVNQFELMTNDVTFDKNYIKSFVKTKDGIVIQLDIDALFEGNIMLDKLLRSLESQTEVMSDDSSEMMKIND